jgi:translation initiation factor 1
VHCVCTTGSKSASAAASSITIWRERKGRGGKEVSIIRDLPLNSMELQLLASALKKHCGSGGTVTNGCIEIQGNQRESIKRYLEQQGYRTKLAGS